jgi:hypothetical protein
MESLDKDERGDGIGETSSPCLEALEWSEEEDARDPRSASSSCADMTLNEG